MFSPSYKCGRRRPWARRRGTCTGKQASGTEAEERKKTGKVSTVRRRRRKIEREEEEEEEEDEDEEENDML